MAETLNKLEKKGQEVVDKVAKASKPVKKEVEKKAKAATKAVKKTTTEAKKTVEKKAKAAKESTTVKKASTKVAKVGKQVAELLTPDKTTVYVQYLGNEYDTKELIARAKQVYVDGGSVAGAVKKIDLYVKPEDNAAYYVINDESTGSIEL